MKYLSLFSGIGGFELGIQQAYVETINRKEDGGSKKITQNGDSKRYAESKSANAEGGRNGEYGNSDGESGQKCVTCVGYSEIDKYAIQIYQKHFPEHKNYGDITKIDPATLPDFDLLVGGFPCQAFSIAGKRKGFDDTRGTLFFEIARILRAKQPRLFLLENVKGLLSHDNGQTFSTIISTLDELGYDLQWQVLNSKNFGVPQNRERVFIVGHIRGTRRPKVFPIRESSTGNLKYSGGVISAREQWLQDGKHNSRNFSQGQRIYDTGGISQTLAGNAGGQGGKTGLYQVAPTIRATEYKRGDNQTVVVEDFYPDRVRVFEESPTLRGDRQGLKVANNLQIRRLTPTECERLQGFPDGWTEGVSDTQRYKTLGNAVTVNVIKEIITPLI